MVEKFFWFDFPYTLQNRFAVCLFPSGSCRDLPQLLPVCEWRGGRGPLPQSGSAPHTHREARSRNTRLASTSPPRDVERIVGLSCSRVRLCYQQSLGPMAVYPIDRIADKFYISAVEPLGDKRRIDELGVTHILNAAQEHLFALAISPSNSALIFCFKISLQQVQQGRGAQAARGHHVQSYGLRRQRHSSHIAAASGGCGLH